MKLTKNSKNIMFLALSLASCIVFNSNATKSRFSEAGTLTTIENLSDALVLKIMESLHGIDLNNAAAVSRRFHKLAQSVKFPRLQAEHSELMRLHAGLKKLNDQAMSQLCQSSRIIREMRTAVPVNAAATSQLNLRQAASQSLALISYPIYGALYSAFCNLVGDPVFAGSLALTGQAISSTVPAVRNALSSHTFINGFTNYAVLQAMTLGLSNLASQIGIPTGTLLGSLIVPICVMFFYINLVLR